MNWIQRLKQLFGPIEAPAPTDSADTMQCPGDAIGDMTCAEVMEQLHAYIDEEIDQEIRDRMKTHFDTAPCECERALLFELSFLTKVRGSVETESIPPDLRNRILKSLVKEG